MIKKRFKEFNLYNIEEKREIYKYGLFVALFNILTILLFFIVGYIFEQLTFSVLLLLFYLPLRISLGGYHCKKALNCFCFFTFILIILNFFEQNRFEKIILIIDIILIVFYFFHQKELTKKMIGNVILIVYFYYLISFQNNSLIYAIFLCLGLYFLQLMSDWYNKFSKDSIQ